MKICPQLDSRVAQPLTLNDQVMVRKARINAMDEKLKTGDLASDPEVSLLHPGGNPGAELKSISHRCCPWETRLTPRSQPFQFILFSLVSGFAG